MGLRFPGQKYGQCFFVTTSFVKRQKLEDRNGIYQALADSLIFYSKKYDVQIAGYVFMPSHIHLLLFIEGDKLASFMRDFKKYTAQTTIRELELTCEFIWMPRYDRVVITSEDIYQEKLNYIHYNPVKADLVKEAGAWKWSSARDYESEAAREISIRKEWF